MRVCHVVLGERVGRGGTLDSLDELPPLLLVRAGRSLGQDMHATVEERERHRLVRVEVVGQHHAIEVVVEKVFPSVGEDHAGKLSGRFGSALRVEITGHHHTSSPTRRAHVAR